MDDLRYIYSVARVRVLETRLLRKEEFSNILAAQTLDLALRLVSEIVNYASDILNVRDSDSLGSFINLEMQKLYRLGQELFIDTSLWQAYAYLKKDLSRSYSFIMQSNSEILKDFIKKFIDLYNIKTFLRMNYQKQPAGVLKTNLIEGGYIALQEFINPVRDIYLEGEQISNGVNQFGESWNGGYYQILKDGLEKIENEGSFSILERDIDDYLASILRPARYIFFGPEPIFGYCLAKENELKALRLILLAKINNISGSEIKKRLTLNYA